LCHQQLTDASQNSKSAGGSASPTGGWGCGQWAGRRESFANRQRFACVLPPENWGGFGKCWRSNNLWAKNRFANRSTDSPEVPVCENSLGCHC